MTEVPRLGKNLGTHPDLKVRELLQRLTLMQALGYTITPFTVMFPNGLTATLMFHPEADQWVSMSDDVGEAWS